MAKRLMSIVIVSIAILTGCNNNEDVADNSIAAPDTTTTIELNAPDDDPVATTPSNDIDWSAIASDAAPAALIDYEYPFDIDSQNVSDYAEYFKVDDATAQHNLTVSMASNEPLSKILDQLGANYQSHELTDGEEIKLIVYTTPNFNASSYDYVLAEDFAKGLVLPIVIKPDDGENEIGIEDEL